MGGISMELEKKYVPVTVHFDANGKMRPIEIEFDEMRRYHIDKILDVRRAACQSVGGVGERYTCRKCSCTVRKQATENKR